MIVGELTSAHIGRTITIKVGGGTATDQLNRVEHDADINEINAFQNGHVRTLVTSNTTVTLEKFGVHDLPSNTRITIQEET